MATNCLIGIAADIINDCDAAPVAGLEAVAYVMNRADVTYTLDATNRNLLTALGTEVGKNAYKLQGFKKNMNAGHDIVVSETTIDKYTQYFKFESWLIDAATTLALDGLSDLVVVVETKNKGVAGDGTFQVYGLETGLYKSSDTRRANDIDGNRVVELTNQAGEESSVSYHVFYDTDYATTQGALEALLA